MSNLKMPDMSFKNLYEILPHNGEWTKIAYATYARVLDDDIDRVIRIQVRHHATTIATIWGSKDTGIVRSIELNNGGYVTATTTERLSAITYDNTDPGYKMWVARKNGKQVFRFQSDKSSIATRVWYDQTTATVIP